MKSISKFVCLILAVGLFGLPGVASATAVCRVLQATAYVAPDPECGILDSEIRWRHFLDAAFLAELEVPNTCFTGQVEGHIADIPFTGELFAGATANPYPPIGDGRIVTTAVTVLSMKDAKGRFRGNLVTRDNGVLDLATYNSVEQHVVVGGNRRFRSAIGTFAVTGNQFHGADVSGWICRSTF